MIVKAANCKHCLPVDIETMACFQPLNTESIPTVLPNP